MKATNMSALVFPSELSIDEYNRLFPNDKCGLKNNEDNVGKGGHMVNNTNLHSKKSDAAEWSSSQGSGWGGTTPCVWSGHQSSSKQATANMKLNDDKIVERQKIKITKLAEKCVTFNKSIAEKDQRIKELIKKLEKSEVTNRHLISEKENLTIKFKKDKHKIDRDVRDDLEDKEEEFREEKEKLERRIKNLEKKVVELEEKEKKDAECKDVLFKKRKKILDDQEVELNKTKRAIELMDEYNYYLNGRIEAFEARQHFSDQIIENLQEDYDW